MSDYDSIHLAITDGHFIDWLYKNNAYSTERVALYKHWRKLCQEYKQLEFTMLLAYQQTPAGSCGNVCTKKSE
jgi:hypothetical protein